MTLSVFDRTMHYKAEFGRFLNLHLLCTSPHCRMCTIMKRQNQSLQYLEQGRDDSLSEYAQRGRG